jgi:hypothetical protein
MEFNESLVISFLVLVIIILIFSKITIGSENDESQYLDKKLSQLEEKLKVTNIPTQQSQQTSDNSLLPDEFKKQLEEMENRFYYDNCRYNKQ